MRKVAGSVVTYHDSFFCRTVSRERSELLTARITGAPLARRFEKLRRHRHPCNVKTAISGASAFILWLCGAHPG